MFLQVSTSLSQTLASTTSSVLLRAGSRRSTSADEEVVQPAAPQKLRDACSDTIDMAYFGQPGSAGFKVRGENYLADKKKVGALPFRVATSGSCFGYGVGPTCMYKLHKVSACI